jgi:Ca2+-binding EF-hand superfamily protein
MRNAGGGTGGSVELVVHGRGEEYLSGKRRLSASAQVEAVAKRLRHAARSSDASVLQSALDSVEEVVQFARGFSQSSHSEERSARKAAEQIFKLSGDIRQRLDTDPRLLQFAALRNSASVKTKVRRLWDLMVLESQSAAGDEKIDCVTREGYRRFHRRLAKALSDGAAYAEDKVKLTADMDWADDISRYSGTSHIAIWLDTIRNTFQAAAAEAVAIQGLTILFSQYDTDGSGDLSREEFVQAVRTDLAIDADTLSDGELAKLFKAVDCDSSGSVDVTELMEWLFGPKDQKARETSRGIAQVKRRFKKAAAGSEACEKIGWGHIFTKHDKDGSGELEMDEFMQAVRTECGLSRSLISDAHFQEMFDVIDSDGSRSIDSEELRELLNADLGGTELNWSAFYSSMLELTTVWSRNATPDQFVLFLQSLFATVVEPVRGHTENLDTLPIFADAARTIPNFGLKAVEDVSSLVAESSDGELRLQIEGFESDTLGEKRKSPFTVHGKGVAHKSTGSAASPLPQLRGDQRQGVQIRSSSLPTPGSGRRQRAKERRAGRSYRTSPDAVVSTLELAKYDSPDLSGVRSHIDTSAGEIRRLEYQHGDADGPGSPAFEKISSPDLSGVGSKVDTGNDGRRGTGGAQHSHSKKLHSVEHQDFGTPDVSHVRSKIDTGQRGRVRVGRKSGSKTRRSRRADDDAQPQRLPALLKTSTDVAARRRDKMAEIIRARRPQPDSDGGMYPGLVFDGAVSSSDSRFRLASTSDALKDVTSTT